jgi:polyphosphate kinase
VTQLFNLLTLGHMGEPVFSRLLVAPISMRSGIQALVEREIEHARAGRGGRIVAKMNSLEDPALVRALYEASAAGVEIDLVVRGVCRLRPGVAGRSETIRVRSIVGRFLEHARIFSFGNAGAPEYFIASADWMSRNLDWRVETMVPIAAPALRAELQTILDLQLADNQGAWTLDGDGGYRRVTPAPGEPELDSQLEFTRRALLRTLR